MGTFELVSKDLAKSLRTVFYGFFSPVSCMITNEIPISGPVFDDVLVGECSWGGPDVLFFWL